MLIVSTVSLNHTQSQSKLKDVFSCHCWLHKWFFVPCMPVWATAGLPAAPLHPTILWREVTAMPYLNRGPLSTQETPPILRETCNWISKFLWLLFHCSVFSVNRALERVKGQSTSGLMVIWECKDNLILRGLLPWDLYGWCVPLRG